LRRPRGVRGRNRSGPRGSLPLGSRLPARLALPVEPPQLVTGRRPGVRALPEQQFPDARPVRRRPGRRRVRFVTGLETGWPGQRAGGRGWWRRRDRRLSPAVSAGPWPEWGRRCGRGTGRCQGRSATRADELPAGHCVTDLETQSAAALKDRGRQRPELSQRRLRSRWGGGPGREPGELERAPAMRAGHHLPGTALVERDAPMAVRTGDRLLRPRRRRRGHEPGVFGRPGSLPGRGGGLAVRRGAPHRGRLAVGRDPLVDRLLGLRAGRREGVAAAGAAHLAAERPVGDGERAAAGRAEGPPTAADRRALADDDSLILGRIEVRIELPPRFAVLP
jgi:hypothetical protein